MVKRAATSVIVVMLAAHLGAQSRASSGESGKSGSGKLPVWATSPKSTDRAKPAPAVEKSKPVAVAVEKPKATVARVATTPVAHSPAPAHAPVPAAIPPPEAKHPEPVVTTSSHQSIRLIWPASDRLELFWQAGSTPGQSLPVLAALPVSATLPNWPVLTTVPSVPAPPVVVPPADPQKPVATPVAQKAPTPSAPRWVDMQALTIATRYRYVDTSAGVVTSNQAQHNEQLRARFKFDGAGRYALTAGLATGTSFTGGWENTGIGTPSDPLLQVYLKQLYLSAAPVKGLEFQIGGLSFSRGEGTEITSYDNDGYLVGERVTMKRPVDFYFDEVSVTRGYLGDVNVPNVLRRTDRLDEWNYYQVMFDKKFTPRFAASTDLTGVDGIRTARASVYAKVPGLVVVDGARFEMYRRLDGLTANGYALTLERAPASWATLAAGVANVDRNYGGLNADRFNKGQRWFVNGSIVFFKDISLQAFYQRAFGNDYTVSNRSRLDVILQLNALKALQRRGIF